MKRKILPTMPYSLIVSCVMLLVKLFSSVFSLISLLYFFKKPQKCPPITEKILLISGRRLVKMIANKEITCEEVIKAYIRRIQQVNSIINAVVQDRFDLAIKEAKAIDNMILASNLTPNELLHNYPLLGLPLTVKESIAVDGCSHGAGKVFLEGKIATKNAPIVALCRNAGAIPLLVSNTPELSANFETTNNVTGRTVNPYNTLKTVGGSSGGEGALLGAGASLIGLGSDICGSLRLPAHFCGVWGHKPSPKTVPIDGHYPLSKHLEEWKELFTLGPMARYARDLTLLLNVILEKNYQPMLKLNEKLDLENVKFYYMNEKVSMFTTTVDDDINKFINKLVEHLKLRYSNSVKKISSQVFKEATESSFMTLLSCNDIEGIFVDKGKNWLNEMTKYMTGRSSSTFVVILLHVIKRLVSLIPSKTIKRYKTNVMEIKRELTKILGSNGVLLLPCYPSAAHYHNQMFGQLFDYSLMGIFNCTGLPVTNCPLGLNDQGLPIGVQVVAAPNNDRLTLAVAEEIERAFGGWVPPNN